MLIPTGSLFHVAIHLLAVLPQVRVWHHHLHRTALRHISTGNLMLYPLHACTEHRNAAQVIEHYVCTQGQPPLRCILIITSIPTHPVNQCQNEGVEQAIRECRHTQPGILSVHGQGDVLTQLGQGLRLEHCEEVTQASSPSTTGCPEVLLRTQAGLCHTVNHQSCRLNRYASQLFIGYQAVLVLRLCFLIDHLCKCQACPGVALHVHIMDGIHGSLRYQFS